MHYERRSFAAGSMKAWAVVTGLGLGGWGISQVSMPARIFPRATSNKLPAPGSYIPTREPTIRLTFKAGQVPAAGRFRAWMDDRDATDLVQAARDGLEWQVAPLTEGLHRVRIEYPPELLGLGRYLTYFYSSRWSFTVDTSKPKLVLLEPKPDAVLRAGPLDVKGITEPANTLSLGGKPLSVSSDGHFFAKLVLEERKSVPLQATNRAGTITVTYLSTKRPVVVHSIYVTGWVAGTGEWFKKIVESTRGTPINAMVVDLKDSTGDLTYPSRVMMAREIGSGTNRIPDLAKVVQQLEKNHLYSIARIAVFPDSYMAQKHPEWMVHGPDGSLWRDRAGLAWGSAYARPLWEYAVAIAKEAAQMGFREIQFDYVRFPSDGDTNNIKLPFKDKRKRYEVIRDFLGWARQQLQPYGVFVSADVYGLVTTGEDLGIGQIMKEIAKQVDYVCPMVYPSHYYAGAYGMPDPDAQPYRTVWLAMQDARKQIKGIPHVKVRPWLQYFSLKHKYGLEQINAQIKAANDAGMDEWLLWNPSNVYPKEVLKGLLVSPIQRPA